MQDLNNKVACITGGTNKWLLAIVWHVRYDQRLTFVRWLIR